MEYGYWKCLSEHTHPGQKIVALGITGLGHEKAGLEAIPGQTTQI